MATFNGRSFRPTYGSRVVHLSAEEAEVMVGSSDTGRAILFLPTSFGSGAASLGCLRCPGPTNSTVIGTKVLVIGANLSWSAKADRHCRPLD